MKICIYTKQENLIPLTVHKNYNKIRKVLKMYFIFIEYLIFSLYDKFICILDLK